MLRLNLSTRPFYNDRAVKVGVALLVLVAAGLSAFNAAQIASLNARNTELVAIAEAGESKATELRRLAQATRQAMSKEDLEDVQADAREANQLIDRRVFSWTELFNRFEETLPADVRIIAVAPQVDKSGLMLVAITVVARNVENRELFIDRLEGTGAFSQVIARTDSSQDDGTIRSIIQGYYVQTDRAAAAVSPPATSDSNDAPGNVSGENATPPPSPGGPR
jgi:hypothetical protein